MMLRITFEEPIRPQFFVLVLYRGNLKTKTKKHEGRREGGRVGHVITAIVCLTLSTNFLYTKNK